jgi:hypothetical protein
MVVVSVFALRAVRQQGIRGPIITSSDRQLQLNEEKLFTSDGLYGKKRDTKLTEYQLNRKKGELRND